MVEEEEAQQPEFRTSYLHERMVETACTEAEFDQRDLLEWGVSQLEPDLRVIFLLRVIDELHPTVELACTGKMCQIVELGNKFAASWAIGRKTFTVVGLRDTAELVAIISALT